MPSVQLASPVMKRPSALEWGVTANGVRHGNPPLKGVGGHLCPHQRFGVAAHVGPRFRGTAAASGGCSSHANAKTR